MTERQNTAGPEGRAKGLEVPADWFENQKPYTVVLDAIRGDETPDSFAIKFSLLTKTPLSKVKHLMHRLPANIWSGQGRGRAERILSYIEEAGGGGSIQEGEARSTPAAPAKAAQERPSCRYCGFPLNEGDKRCGFCRTSVDAVLAPAASGAGDSDAGLAGAPAKGTAAIPVKRLLLYAAILAVGILVLRALG